MHLATTTETFWPTIDSDSATHSIISTWRDGVSLRLTYQMCCFSELVRRVVLEEWECGQISPLLQPTREADSWESEMLLPSEKMLYVPNVPRKVVWGLFSMVEQPRKHCTLYKRNIVCNWGFCWRVRNMLQDDYCACPMRHRRVKGRLWHTISS